MKAHTDKLEVAFGACCLGWPWLQAVGMGRGCLRAPQRPGRRWEEAVPPCLSFLSFEKRRCFWCGLYRRPGFRLKDAVDDKCQVVLTFLGLVLEPETLVVSFRKPHPGKRAEPSPQRMSAWHLVPFASLIKSADPLVI